LIYGRHIKRQWLFFNHWSCAGELKLTAVALPVVVYSTAAAAAGSALRGGGGEYFYCF
jgi:hypothetical protein